MNKILFFSQIAVCALLIASILLQQRGTALGSSFGGEGGSYLKKRGMEKFLFVATIILAGLFVAVSLLSLNFAA